MAVLLTLNIFHTFSSAFIVDFEQVCWEVFYKFIYSYILYLLLHIPAFINWILSRFQMKKCLPYTKTMLCREALHQFMDLLILKGAFFARSETIFDNWKPFQNDEKCFLFHLKSSFRSQDILIFHLKCWSCRKTTLLER